MGREIKILSFCDACEREGVHTEGNEYTIAIDRMQPRLVIMCEVHEKDILSLKELIEPLQKADAPVGPGRPNAAQAAVGQKISCAICGKAYKNPGSMRRHVNRDHDLSTQAYEEKIGAPFPRAARDSGKNRGKVDADTPLDYDDDFTIPDEFKCDLCDVAYDPRQYKMPAQAIGMHRRRTHGIRLDGTKVGE
jgi:predicted transcriptional regulator